MRAFVSPSGPRTPKLSRVTGDFNEWDTRRHPMRRRTGGVWEIFIPGLGEGSLYKYHVRSRFHGHQQQKADPYGFCREVPPKSASVVCDLDKYAWSDAEWHERARRTRLSERARLHLRSSPGILAARPAEAQLAHLPRAGR